MFFLSFGYVLLAIRYAEWALVEKGFYTVCLCWITFSAFSLVKVLRDRQEGLKTAGEYRFLAWISMVASFSIGMIAIWNADWLLVEMGLLFTTYTSISLAKVIRDRHAASQVSMQYGEKEPGGE